MLTPVKTRRENYRVAKNADGSFVRLKPRAIDRVGQTVVKHLWESFASPVASNGDTEVIRVLVTGADRGELVAAWFPTMQVIADDGKAVLLKWTF